MRIVACKRREISFSNVASTANPSSTLGKMAGVSKDKLRKEITVLLKNADLVKTSSKKIRQQLEEKLEVDLTDQKDVVDELIMELLKEKKTGGKKGKKADSEDDDDGEEEENGGGEDEDDDEDESEKTKKKGPSRGIKNKRATDSEEPSDEDDDEDFGARKKAKTTHKKGGAKKKKKGSDNDSDEDWGKSKKKSGGGAKRGGAKGGYTKPCTLSPELAKLVGKDTMPRHEVVKKIWAIIKERDLYDPENRQYAICDSDLLKVFGVERFRTFGMMKYLKNHFIS